MDENLETKDEVKTEEVKTEEKEVSEKKYSDEDLDRIISEKFAKWQKKKEEEISEAEKLANMNANEKLKYEKEKIEDELNSLKSENLRNKLAKEVRNSFKEEGISVSDELVDMLVTNNAEDTKKNSSNFIKYFKTELEKAVKEKMKGETPKRMNSSQTFTKEQILEIKDPIERRRMIANNIELFE